MFHFEQFMYFSSTINVRFLNYVKFIFWNYILPLKLAFPLHAGASEKKQTNAKKNTRCMREEEDSFRKFVPNEPLSWV